MSLENSANDKYASDGSRPRVIAGFGRSGTTWVQDVLATSNALRPVFEPLHPRHVKGADAFAHRYYGESDSVPALRDFLERFFFGTCDSLWTDYRIISDTLRPRLSDFKSVDSVKRRFRAYRWAKNKFLCFHGQRRHDHRIVKFIRANMMLSWLRESFGARIVFIVRHPGAVIMSQLRAAEFWDPYENLERYRHDEKLNDLLSDRVKRPLFDTLDRVEALALSWCIENSVALRQCRQAAIPVIFYEELVEEGAPHWQRILGALDLEIAPDPALISQPSQQTWGSKARSAQLVRKYASWKDKSDPAMLAKIQAMLDAAEIGIYRASDVFPITSGS